MTNEPQCFDCVHLDHSNSFNPLRCRAILDGIPVPIKMNKHDHRKPYPGDHGIRFEPMTQEQTAATPTDKKPGKTIKGRVRR